MCAREGLERGQYKGGPLKPREIHCPNEICFPPPWPFLGGNFSRTSPVSECLGSKALTVLSLDFLFKDVGITVLKDSVFLQSKGQACLLPTRKDSGFLSSESLSCNETTELSGIHLGPST